ncbi:hypothetical protein [uncultured Thermanaerothrix sp.]|uniref:hypothetical protein n=1 Tax=uncultured Thermanaerothrix sp. TaxID=1195149 RepID=UPI0026357EB2|nr:hypothetical protein [uncultured Thermanaerothrix sp.]
MSAPNSPSSNGVGRAIRAFLKAVLRLLLVILLGLILGAGLYAGGVVLYQRAILPAEENAARLNALETEQAGRFALIKDQLATHEAQLQTQHAVAYEMMMTSTLQLATQSVRLDALEKRVYYMGELIGELGEDTDWLRTQVAVLGTSLVTWEGRLSTLEAQVEQNRSLVYELQAMRAASHVLRARQYLAAGNYGLAKSEIAQARERLIDLWKQVPAAQQATVQAWLERLQLAEANLPDLPVLAAEDLDIAWQLLLAGLPPLYATPTPLRTLASPPGVMQSLGTVTPTISAGTPILQMTSTPTPAFGATPSPTPALSPTPSPQTP